MRWLGILAMVWAAAGTAGARATEETSGTFPGNWSALGDGEAAIVFIMRSYGADFSFAVCGGDGTQLDRLTIPEGTTSIVQYRVPSGTYDVSLLDRTFQTRAQAGFFSSMGVAMTHMPAEDGKQEGVIPDFAPFAAYMPSAMEARVEPLIGFGPTTIPPPKSLGAAVLDFRLVDRSLPSSDAAEGTCGEPRRFETD